MGHQRSRYGLRYLQIAPSLQYVSGRSSECWRSEFVKQLLSWKHFIMTNPSERIVWFYGRHQPDLFCSLTQEIPCTEFYEGLPTNIEVMFDRSKRNICIIDDLMQSASGNQLVKNLLTNGRHLNLSVVFVSRNLFYKGKKSL